MLHYGSDSAFLLYSYSKQIYNERKIRLVKASCIDKRRDGEYEL